MPNSINPAVIPCGKKDFPSNPNLPENLTRRNTIETRSIWHQFHQKMQPVQAVKEYRKGHGPAIGFHTERSQCKRTHHDLLTGEEVLEASPQCRAGDDAYRPSLGDLKRHRSCFIPKVSPPLIILRRSQRSRPAFYPDLTARYLISAEIVGGAQLDRSVGTEIPTVNGKKITIAAGYQATESKKLASDTYCFYFPPSA
jgi:hypothetical protein